MKAIVFAAGLGTRLRPLTNYIPKALVDIGGACMLELVIKKLAAAGVDEMVVNTHHFHSHRCDGYSCGFLQCFYS